MQNIDILSNKAPKKCCLPKKTQRYSNLLEGDRTSQQLHPPIAQQFNLNSINANSTQVLLPFHSTHSPFQINTHACLIFPPRPTHRRTPSQPPLPTTPTTTRKYRSSHEAPPAPSLSSLSQRKPKASISNHTAKVNLPTMSSTARDSTWKIPKLKKHWNSNHPQQTQNKRNKNPLQLPLSFGKQRQRSDKSGCIALEMQCIPFEIWNRKSHQQLKTHKKTERLTSPVSCDAGKEIRQLGTDQKKRMQLLTREDNLRRKLLIDLFSSACGSHTRRPFISYFPHTDYDLALKAYLSRQEDGQRRRLLSASPSRHEEETNRQPVPFRRESCFVFTEFNRKKYDIKMSREELIEKIITSKASQQITGSLLKEITQKVSEIISPIIKQTTIPSIDAIEENIDESISASHHALQQKSESVYVCEKTGQFQVNPPHHLRVSRILPIVPAGCESQHKILTELIEEISSHTPDSSLAKPQSKKGNESSGSQSRDHPRTKKPPANKMSRFQKDHVIAKNHIDSQSTLERSLLHSKKKDPKKLTTSYKEESRHAAVRRSINRKENDLKRENKQIVKRKIDANSIAEEKIINEDTQHCKSKQTFTRTIPEEDSPPILSVSKAQEVKPQTHNNKNDEEWLSEDDSKMEIIRLPFNRIVDCSQLIMKLEIASKILNIVAPDLWKNIIHRKLYFLNGKWIKLKGVSKFGSNLQNYALGLAELCREYLKMAESAISLETMLKFITGQRVIVFKHKSALEKQILYHKSKQHHIYLLHRRNHKLFTLHAVRPPSRTDPDRQDHPKAQYEIQSMEQDSEVILCTFQTILENCQLISINNRINTHKHHRHALDCQIFEAESPIISLSAQESTSGTITLYFPAYHGTLYVELIMEKVRDKNGTVKSIGRVYERLKYDNIYFEFTIKGEYQLRIRLEEHVNTQCRIAYQGNNPVHLAIADQ